MTSDPVETVVEHAISLLFKAAGIKRVISVDDAYAATLDSLLETLAGFTAAERGMVFDTSADEYSEEEVWQQRVREQWEAWGQHERASRVDSAYAIEAETTPVGTGAVHALRELLPNDIELRGMTLKQWKDERKQIVSELPTIPTLVLFDQDFKHEEGGGSNTGERMIAELDAELKKLHVGIGVYYGLLTNTAGIDELDRRHEIAKAPGIDPARLVVISKRNLDDEELTRFAARLRTTLLAPILAALLGAVSAQVDKKQKDSLKKAHEIPPEDMEHMVIRAADREGEWPPDTMVRVLEAIERNKVREQLRISTDVADLTTRLRAIAAIPMPSGDAPSTGEGTTDGESPSPTLPQSEVTSKPGQSPRVAAPVRRPAAVQILHEEIYDDAEHVNRLHLPIELGDVIRRTSDGKLWVVVTQPCDLMVRERGVRAPDLSHITLVALAEKPDDATPVQQLFAEFELPYYFTDEKRHAFVRLSRPAFVRALILDCCVLNADGSATLDLTAETPERLLPNWKLRHKELKKLGRKLLDRTSEEKDKLDGETVAGHYRLDIFRPATIDHGALLLKWDCQRVARVGDPYARALLSRFTQYFARDAYLNDLARQ